MNRNVVKNRVNSVGYGSQAGCSPCLFPSRAKTAMCKGGPTARTCGSHPRNARPRHATKGTEMDHDPGSAAGAITDHSSSLQAALKLMLLRKRPWKSVVEALAVSE